MNCKVSDDALEVDKFFFSETKLSWMQEIEFIQEIIQLLEIYFFKKIAENWKKIIFGDSFLINWHRVLFKNWNNTSIFLKLRKRARN